MNAPQDLAGQALLQSIDIGHADYQAVIDPTSAFWSLVRRDRLAGNLPQELVASWRENRPRFVEEWDMLRFGLKPSGVYVNPTERCNLDCTYCYIPSKMRRSGEAMSADKLTGALDHLKNYFNGHLEGRKARVIFHGAEPLSNKSAVFAAIEAHRNDFLFGVQTNGTLLDNTAIDFLTSRGVSVGLSLDGPDATITDATRRTWGGRSVHQAVLTAMDKLKGYDAWSVIATCTERNLETLVPLVDLFHAREVPTCMLNAVRCTLPRARTVKPADLRFAEHFLAALDRTHQHYRDSGRKLVVANFANILLAILAPTARRLMCDLSPCGGGRAFFALAPDGSLFPCSEFIGLPQFNGGNLFEQSMESVLASPAFRQVTERNIDDFAPCGSCAIRPFCGSPCPAEAAEMNGGMDQTGAFCDFYKAQTAYAFRLIADGIADDYLWDGWDDGVATSLDLRLR